MSGHSRRVAQPIADRIKAAVTIDDAGCWIWQRSKNTSGYGQMQVGSWTDNSRRVMPAHRASYEAFVGPIPEGLQIDHLCMVRACVNPEHLEPVTARLNCTRRSAANDGVELCPRGRHRVTPLNTAYGRGGRKCLPCLGRLQ